MADSSFLFVKVHHTGKVAPNKDVRTAIQKHVMRDIGAARKGNPRPRPQAKPKLRLKGKKGEGDTRRAGDEWQSVQANKIPGLISGGLRGDPFAYYPVSMNSDTLFLIDYVYTTPELRLRPIRDTWLPLAFSDPAFFYEILSHISLDISSSHSSSSSLYHTHSNRKALILHSHALRSVNERISDPVVGLSDGVIGTILAFACFSGRQHAAKDWESYAMHMDGLLAIIQAKGGVHKIDHNRILRLLLSGIDVSASCFAGTPARFPLPIPLLNTLRTDSQELPWWLPLPASSSEETNVWTVVFPNDAVLAIIFRDLSTTVMTIKLEIDKRVVWHDGQFGALWVDPLTHRLLESSVEMEDIHEGNFLAECCRLSALILLSKIRRRFGTHKRRLVFTGVETGKIRIVLGMYADKWTKFKPMLLWVLILTALEVDEEERTWLCGLIEQTALKMGLQSWDEAVGNASNLLWVGEVLDEECEGLRSLVQISNLER